MAVTPAIAAIEAEQVRLILAHFDRYFWREPAKRLRAVVAGEVAA